MSLIDEIAEKWKPAYGETPDQVKQTITGALTEYAQRADAPEAKPVGWFQNIYAHNAQPPHYEQVAKEYEGTDGTIPLFAHPPSGVTVPVERLQRWQVMMESCAESGMEPVIKDQFGNVSMSPNGLLHQQEAAAIEAMLAAAKEGK